MGARHYTRLAIMVTRSSCTSVSSKWNASIDNVTPWKYRVCMTGFCEMRNWEMKKAHHGLCSMV